MAASLASLRTQWAAQWPAALAVWSKFTRLRDPRWCLTLEEARQEGLTESFAMIRLVDQAVVISLPLIQERRLERFALEILAHEVGHHILCPADLGDHGRLIARMRWGLPTKEHLAAFVGNLYADLLINDRLQRSAGLDEAAVYATLGGTPDRLWTLYMRLFEILWGHRRGSLANGQIDDQLDGDAHLGARLIRVYSRDWLEGAGKFAALCLPYLLENDGAVVQKLLRVWLDTRQSGAGSGDVPGLTEVEGDERRSAIHPSQDPALVEIEEEAEVDAGPPPQEAAPAGGQRGQYRDPFEYGEILKALGLNLSDHEIAVRYYRERATPYLVRFPARETPQAADPLMEGTEPWDIGAPLQEADWLESILVSPRVIPGVTTVQRVWGVTEGDTPRREPLDLDLYVDCSGSMPNPQRYVSYLALAGAIMALSALRAGARVQATLWSGARQFETTGGFIRDAHRILQILTGYLGGGTAFPLHLLRDTYAERKPADPPVHLLVISDEGVTTMFDKDEQNHSGWEIAQQALDRARGGGTLVLNLYREWTSQAELVRAHQELGWQVATVRDWEELVEFARQFGRRNYGAAGDFGRTKGG